MLKELSKLINLLKLQLLQYLQFKTSHLLKGTNTSWHSLHWKVQVTRLQMLEIPKSFLVQLLSKKINLQNNTWLLGESKSIFHWGKLILNEFIVTCSFQSAPVPVELQSDPQRVVRWYKVAEEAEKAAEGLNISYQQKLSKLKSTVSNPIVLQRDTADLVTRI